MSHPHRKQIIESYRLEAEKAAKDLAKAEPFAETVGGGSSGSVGPGGAPAAVARHDPPLPGLLMSKIHREINKKIRKLENGGDLACAPMVINGFLGDG